MKLLRSLTPEEHACVLEHGALKFSQLKFSVCWYCHRRFIIPRTECPSCFTEVEVE